MTSENVDVKNNNKEISNVEKFYENYILIDIGAYFVHKKFMRDLDSVVQRAKDAGKAISMVTESTISYHLSLSLTKTLHLPY